MSNFVYDREVVEYHSKITEREISYYSSLLRELPHYSPDYTRESRDYINALADAEARLEFWNNVTINNDEA